MFHHPQTKEAYNEGKTENFGEKKKNLHAKQTWPRNKKHPDYFYIYERLNASETLCGAP